MVLCVVADSVVSSMWLVHLMAICVHFLFEKKGRYMRIHLIEHSVVIGGFLFDFAAGSLC